MSKVQDENIVNLIKEICKGVIDSSKPSSFFYGTVISINPLKVQLSSNLILTSKFLKVPKSLTDYKVSCGIDWNTESTNTDHTHTVTFNDRYNSSGDAENKTITTSMVNSNTQHSHEVKGIKEITIYNGLKIGDKVYLAQVQGGQDFIILDKVVE